MPDEGANSPLKSLADLVHLALVGRA